MARSLALVALTLLVIQGVLAYDPTITADFGLMGPVTGFVAQFPGVTGLGISSIFFKLGSGGLVPLHIHSRATELFIAVQGTWTVGFIDSANTHYTAQLKEGDQFVFPVGLIHYQLAGNSAATGYSSFNSENPGVTLIGSNIFTATPPIPDAVATGSFGIDAATLASIRKALAPPPPPSP
ncbi:hypothetical protein R1sor_019489 [Riccia sorocarpa]|uniref:Germin-like protein n=1 Tax=Riccia sorocarpa TaxID=122646 RepID=A0ABD3IFD3_9MARC